MSSEGAYAIWLSEIWNCDRRIIEANLKFLDRLPLPELHVADNPPALNRAERRKKKGPPA